MIPGASPAATLPPGADRATWIARSNESSKLLLELRARYNPEDASSLGIDGYDDRILDLEEGHATRYRADALRIAREIEERGRREPDARVRQDLAILVHSAKLAARTAEVSEAHTVPLVDVADIVFQGVQGLLDDRIAASRRPAAARRLRRYAGLETGTRPLAELARAETCSRQARRRVRR